MDVIWSLALLIGIVAVLAYMVGGRPAGLPMSIFTGLGRALGGILGSMTGAAGSGIKSGFGVSSSEPMKPHTFGAPEDPEQ